MMDKFIHGDASRLQFAANGEWERSLVAPTAGELREWLAAAPTDIAVEIFLDSPGDRQRFIGVRLARLRAAERERMCFSCLELLHTMPRPAADRLPALLREQLAVQTLFLGRPAFLELGVVDAWRSTDPVRFWSPTSERRPLQSFLATLESHPRYRAGHSRPVAIEIAFAGPPEHWLGIVISDEYERAHRINHEAAARLLDAIDPSARG